MKHITNIDDFLNERDYYYAFIGSDRLTGKTKDPSVETLVTDEMKAKVALALDGKTNLVSINSDKRIKKISAQTEIQAIIKIRRKYNIK